MNIFTEKVKAVVKKIPAGTTRTYKEVAMMAGNSRASRAVGSIMKKNLDPKVPCHRVVRSDGALGDYNRGGPQKKLEILRKEGYTNF